MATSGKCRPESLAFWERYQNASVSLTALLDQRYAILQLRTKGIGFREAIAGLHRVCVSAESVDLTVVAEVTEGGPMTPNCNVFVKKWVRTKVVLTRVTRDARANRNVRVPPMTTVPGKAGQNTVSGTMYLAPVGGGGGGEGVRRDADVN